MSWISRYTFEIKREETTQFMKICDTFKEKCLCILSHPPVFQPTLVGQKMCEILSLYEKNITWQTVLDHGCGTWFLGIVAKQLWAHNIIFHDICSDALLLAQKNIRFNHLAGQEVYIDTNQYPDTLKAQLIVSNLPQNPNSHICGKWGSELQIRETLNIAEHLSPNGLIISKTVSYASDVRENRDIQERFFIEEIETGICQNPNTWEDATVTYLALKNT